MANAEKLRRVLGLVELLDTDPNSPDIATHYPELENVYRPRWNQYAWLIQTLPNEDGDDTECGTFGCFAGWASVLYAPELRSDTDRIIRRAVWYDRRGKAHLSIMDAAVQVLDLDENQAKILFDANNNLTDLQRAVEAICEGTL